MSLPLIGITMGDPVGVGPEIIVKALARPEAYRVCRPMGDQGVLLKTIRDLGIQASVEVVDRVPEEGYVARKIYLFPTSRLRAESLRIGQPDHACGEAMVNAIREATRWTIGGEA